MSIGPCTDFATALVCYTAPGGAKTTLVAHYEYAKSVIGSSILRAIRFTTADGVPFDTSAGTVTPGVCPIDTIDLARVVNHGGGNYAAGTFIATHDPDNLGAAFNASALGGRLQSITVTALEAGAPSSGNAVEILHGATATRNYLTKGQTFTWSVAQDTGRHAEELDVDLVVTAQGNSAFAVAWTEEA